MSMRENFGYSIFCDDIREELGGKISYMGVYNGALQVHSDAPVSIPKLGIAMTVVVPGPASIQTVSFVVQQETDGKLVDIFSAEPVMPAESDVAEGRVGKVGIHVQLTPFTIQGNSVLKARSRVNGEEVKLGTLQIQMIPTGLSPAGPEPLPETAEN